QEDDERRCVENQQDRGRPQPAAKQSWEPSEGDDRRQDHREGDEYVLAVPRPVARDAMERDESAVSIATFLGWSVDELTYHESEHGKWQEGHQEKACGTTPPLEEVPMWFGEHESGWKRED